MTMTHFVIVKLKRNFLAALAFVFCLAGAYGQSPQENEVMPDGVAYAQIPHVKIYLHTNKSNFIAGESIWFKAYVTDYFKSVPDTAFSAIYVDLVNYEGKAVDLTAIEVNRGMGTGSIFIPDSLLAGSYALRAYHTNTLPNIPSLSFQKTIQVENPIEENFFRRSDRRDIRRYNRMLEQKESRYHASFHPESGNLVAGIVNKVVMRVTNELEQGVDFSAVIKDNRGNKVAETQSSTGGFAEFFFQPTANTFYHAEIEIDSRRQGDAPLPEVIRHGYNMILENANPGRNLVIQSAINPGAANSESEVLAILQHQGEVRQVKRFDFSSQAKHQLFLDDKLEPGVNIVSLTNTDGELLAERMIYKYGFESLQPSIELIEFEKEDSLFLSVNISLDEMKDSYGNFSMSITDMPAVENISQESLVSYLWLSSDLEASVNAPQMLLSRQENEEFVDYLMIMASGMRYRTHEELLQLKDQDDFVPATGLALRGKLVPRGSSHATGYATVQMSVNVEGKSDIRNQETNSNGQFVFDKLDYPGAFKVEVTPGLDTRGRKLMVEMEPARTPPVRINQDFKPRELPSRGDDWQRVSRPVTYVNVQKVKSASGPGSMYGNADQVLFVDDLPPHVSNVMDALRGRIPGLSIVDGQINMRGPSSVNMSNEPIFVIDGNVVNSGSFLAMNVRELERIEILKGSNAVMFGSRGANGAIIGITRSGDQSLSPTHEFLMEGFSLPSDFLSYLYNKGSRLGNHENFVHTHYWEPELVFDHETEQRITFPLFSKTNRYFIVIEGVDSQGRVLSVRQIVDIRD